MNHILEIYNQAGPGDIRAGKAWYRDAQRAIQELARKVGLSERRVAGIVAALSPRMPWDKNLEDAHRIILGQASIATRLNQDKARRILAGEDPEQVLAGSKVRAFYRNLTDPDDPQAVTVDAWAYRVYSGDLAWNRWVHPALYRRVAHAYQETARALGLLPSQLQAITWLTIRRLAKAPGQLVLDL